MKPRFVSAAVSGEPRETRGQTEDGASLFRSRRPPAATEDAWLGTTLEKRYRLEGVLGRGGMGIVYRARHLVLGTTLAVKLVRGAARSADYAERFLQEAQLASRVKHPSTVQIYDFGIAPDGQPFLVMELVVGRTLREVLRGSGLSVERACRIAIQLAYGMQAIHDKGVIHRDLKPENIFLLEEHGARDFVKIGDFGLAQELAPFPEPRAEAGARLAATDESLGIAARDGSTNLDSPMVSVVQTLPGSDELPPALPGQRARAGTPAYMSPEQVLGAHVDASTDQYSLGCVLYELLTGSPPFSGTRLEELLDAQVRALPRAPRQLVDGLPESLSALTLRMLSKEPAERLPSMLAVAHVLELELQALIPRAEATGSELPPGLQRGPTLARNTRARLTLAALIALGTFFTPPWSRQSRLSELTEVELSTLKTQALATLDGVLQGADTGTLVQTLAMMAVVQNPEIAARLRSLLSDPRPQVRAAAARAVRSLGDRSLLVPLQRLLSPLEPPIVRLAAAASLADLGDPAGRSELQVWMTPTADRDFRIEAAQHLCRLGHEHARDVLRADIADLRGQPVAALSPSQRASLLASLSCLASAGDADARTTLESLARAAELPALRLAALEPLVAMRNDVGITIARDLMTTPGPDQLAAANLLASRGDPAAMALCRRVLATKTVASSELLPALLGLAADGEPSDVRRTAQWQNEPRMEVRAAAALATLRLLTNAPAVMTAQSLRWVRTVLADRQSQMRLVAVEILGALASTEAEALLEQLCADENALVRRAALHALLGHPGMRALECIGAHLDDRDSEVRWDAIVILGRLIAELRRNGHLGMAEQGLRLLRSLAAQGAPAERVLASTFLLRLGEPVLDSLLGLVQATPVAARLHMVRELPARSELISAMLSDADAGVRLAAAQRLAQLGSKAGLAVLRASSQHGGWPGAVATVLRARLGDAEGSANAARYSVQSPFLLRLAALVAAQVGPAENRRADLWQALSDPEPVVRRLVALRAAELEDGAPVLSALHRDPDPMVRAQAQALLGRRLSSAASLYEPVLESIAARASHERTEHEPEDQRGTDKDLATPRAEPGRLLLRASSSALVQLDDGPWGPASPQPLVLSAGPHVLRTVEGTQTIQITPAMDTARTLTAGPAELAYARALQAAKDQRYAESGRNLDEAEALCRAASPHSRPGCRTLLLAISFLRGQMYSAQHMLPEAMQHYQIVLGPAARTAVVPRQRNEASAASARLSRQLGRVLLEHRRGERCVVDTLWMLPGQKSVTVDGVRQVFQVRVGATLRVGGCT